LLDYHTPLVELIDTLLANTQTDLCDKLKRDILSYVSYTLAGRNFPQGTPINNIRLMEAKTQVLQCLFDAVDPNTTIPTVTSQSDPTSPRASSSSSSSSSSVDEQDRTAACSQAPAFRIIPLLRLDTQRCLDAISNAFNDTRFSIHHANSLSHHVVTHARMVDVLTAIIVDTTQPTFAAPEPNAAWQFTPEQQASYFSFLAKHIAHGTVALPKGCNLMQRIFSCLTWTTGVDDGTHGAHLRTQPSR
jgi:hypothetical protein